MNPVVNTRQYGHQGQNTCHPTVKNLGFHKWLHISLELARQQEKIKLEQAPVA
jgi:hypothetical protein